MPDISAEKTDSTNQSLSIANNLCCENKLISLPVTKPWYYICLWKKEHGCSSTDHKSRMYSPIFNTRLWIYDTLCGNPQKSLSITSQVSLLNLEKICPPHSKKAYPTQIEKGERIYSLLEQKLEFSSIPRSPVRIHISSISNFFSHRTLIPETELFTHYRDPPKKKIQFTPQSTSYNLKKSSALFLWASLAGYNTSRFHDPIYLLI